MQRLPIMMATRGNREMKSSETRALLAVYDNGPGTCRKIGVTRHTVDNLEAMGFVRLIMKRRLDGTGAVHTIVSITSAGIREAIATGKRFGKISLDKEIKYRSRTRVKRL